MCRLAELEIERGVAALVHGQAVAIFRVDEATVYALANHDPFDRHATLAKGHRRASTGTCRSWPHRCTSTASTCAPASASTTRTSRVAAYDVKVVEGVVLVGQRKTAAA